MGTHEGFSHSLLTPDSSPLTIFFKKGNGDKEGGNGGAVRGKRMMANPCLGRADERN